MAFCQGSYDSELQGSMRDNDDVANGGGAGGAGAGGIEVRGGGGVYFGLAAMTDWEVASVDASDQGEVTWAAT